LVMEIGIAVTPNEHQINLISTFWDEPTGAKICGLVTVTHAPES
jgi:hypothetical protein